MEDIDRIIKNIKDTRRKITHNIDLMVTGEEPANNQFDTGSPDDRSVWAVSFISKQKELDFLKSVILKKEQEVNDITLKMRTLEYRLSNDQHIWQSKVQLKEEEHKVRLLTLENQNEYLRNENSIIKEGMARQLEELREQKRVVEQDLMEIRNKCSTLERDFYAQKSEITRLKSEKDELANQIKASVGVGGDTETVKILRKQIEELKTKEAGFEEAGKTDKDQIIGSVFSSDILQSIELMQEKEKLQFLNLDNFSRGYAHKFRNLLGVISGTAQLALCDDKMSKEVKEQFQTIDDNCAVLLKVIEQLLMLTKMPEMQHVKSPVNTYVDTIASAYEDKVKSQNIKIIKQLAKDLPNVSCDARLMNETFEALIINAMEAMPNGGEIKIQTGMDEKRGMVYVKFIDNGIGVPDNHIKKVFQPYFTSKKDHNGIGLSLVQRNIDVHCGMVFLESVKDKGTTVTLLLPKAKE